MINSNIEFVLNLLFMKHSCIDKNNITQFKLHTISLGFYLNI